MADEKDSKNGNEDIVRELKEFARSSNAEMGKMLMRVSNDLAFASGEQIDDNDLAIRGAGRAKVVLNLTHGYCGQIVNSFRAKPYGITLNSRTTEAVDKATITQGIIRGIESRSNAEQAYTMGVDRQVKGGRGYVVITTDYSSENGFEQEINIQGVIRPDMVIWDEYSKEVDGSDATRCAFVEHISKSKAEDLYGLDIDERNTERVLVDTCWAAPDGSIEVVTYFKLQRNKTKIYMDDDGNILQADQVRKNSKMKSRTTTKTSLMVYKVVAGQVVSDTELPLTKIPVVPFLGELVDVEKKTDWVGIPFFARDPARLVNGMAALTAERIALGPKSTVYVDPESIANDEDVWQQSNKINLAYLPVSTFDEQGNKFNSPQPRDAAVNIGDVSQSQSTSQANLSSVLGMSEAGAQMQGSPNETASAVLTRAKSQELSNLPFIDNAAKSIKQIGRIILQLIPVIYDTERLLPLHDGVSVKMQMIDVQKLGIVADDYEVDVDAGPMVATQRKEEFQSLIGLAGMLGPDITLAFASDIVRNSDFSNAEEIASKLDVMAKIKLGLTNPNEQQNGSQQDPDAIAALNSAQQTVQTLQSNLQQANTVIMQLQNELQGQKDLAAAEIAKAQIDRETQIDVASIKAQGSMSVKQMDIQAKAQAQANKAVADLQTAQAANANKPVEIISGLQPEYHSVDGLINKLP